MKLLYLFLIAITHDKVVAMTQKEFPQEVTIESQKLILNGTGIRKATWLKVNVYYGALYLEKKITTPEQIMALETPKRIYMKFLRSVSKSEFQGGWSDAFEKSVPKAKWQELDKIFNDFQEIMIPIKKGETVVIDFLKTSMTIDLAGKVNKTFSSSEFSKAILSLWFVNPIDPELMKSFLGN